MEIFSTGKKDTMGFIITNARVSYTNWKEIQQKKRQTELFTEDEIQMADPINMLNL